MICLPLKKISDKNKSHLLEIYSRCDNRGLYSDKKIAQAKQAFIHSAEDQDWIYTNILNPLGLATKDVKNYWKYEVPEDISCGILFNIFRKGDWCLPHKDFNPTVLLILLEGESCKLEFPQDNFCWTHTCPAVLNVSKLHIVKDLKRLESDRITLKVFLKDPIDHYKKIINKEKILWDLVR